MRRIVYLLAALTVLAGGGAAATAQAGDHPDKVTLCHASGLAGTTKYETLTIGYEAAYGPAGHFDENGTPNAGHEQDYLGECHETPPPVDYCPTLPGVQAEDEDCPPPPPVDVCPNLEGVQETVPPGMGIVNGECVPVDVNPQCSPPGVLVEGVCIFPPPPPVNPPNVRGDANVFCDLGAQLYRVTGTIDGNTVDTAIPVTIAGNTRGFTNVTLVRGDTQFRTVVFTYGDCSLSPPVITTPAAVPTPAAPATRRSRDTGAPDPRDHRRRRSTTVNEDQVQDPCDPSGHHTMVIRKTVIKKVLGKCPRAQEPIRGLATRSSRVQDRSSVLSKDGPGRDPRPP